MSTPAGREAFDIVEPLHEIFLNFGNDGDFEVTEELLPCLKSSRNSALNEP